MNGFLLSSNSNFQRMSAPGATSPSASPGEIWMRCAASPFIDMQMIQSLRIQRKMGSRGGYDAIYILSFTSPSTSHISMQAANANASPPPPSLKKPTTEKRHIRPFICTGSSSLPSFHPAITATGSPPCKMQVHSRLELRDHMLHPHQQRARWSDNATTTLVSTSDDYESSHTFDMQRKIQAVNAITHPNIDSANTRDHPSPDIVTVMKNPPEPQASKTQDKR
jgi:hypothetical protein